MSTPPVPSTPATLPPPPAKKGPRTWIVVLCVLGAMAILGSVLDQQHDPGTPSSTFDDPVDVGGTSAVDVEVLTCEVAFGYATARISVTSSEVFDYVGFAGDFEDAHGAVIGQGIGSLSDVVPGQTYKTEVIYSLTGKGAGGTCSVRVDSAF